MTAGGGAVCMGDCMASSEYLVAMYSAKGLDFKH
jgi:hypothetical protein